MALRGNFFVLGEIFLKLFHIDKQSRRDISDFQAETKHNDSHYGPNKGRQVKKERRKESLLGSCLHIFVSVSVTRASCYLCCTATTGVACSIMGKLCRCSWRPPATNPGHTVQPSPMVNSISAAKMLRTPSKATPTVTKATLPLAPISNFLPEKVMYGTVAERAQATPGTGI